MHLTRVFLPVLFFLFSESLAAQIEGTSLAEARKSGKANLTYVYETVTSSKELQNGLIFSDDANNEAGVLVDLTKAFENFVFNTYGIRVTGRYIKPENTFQGFLEGIKNGRGGVFGLSSVSITEKRKKVMQFSPPFLNSMTVLVTRNEVPTLSSLDNIQNEFKDMTAYCIPSTIDFEILSGLKKEKYPELEILPVNSPLEVLAKISSDPGNFGYVDLILYLKYLGKGNSIRRHPVGDLQGDKYGIIMPLNSEWGSIMTEFFNSGYLQSAEYRKSVIKHIGKEALRML